MKRTAVYSGTFDPITNGHLDVLKKASKQFDEVILAVAKATGKNTLFTDDERLWLCKKTTENIANINVKIYDGLTVEFCKKEKASIMIRGLRAVSDFEYELQLALMNKKLDYNLDTIFFIPNHNYLYLSSSMVREIIRLGGKLDEFVPECVYEALLKKFKGVDYGK
jgi:pantetheine-phosphate adenylyltransferase